MRTQPFKKERGQIIILMMFAIIPIMLLMATIFNGGFVVAQKTRLQNATDTSVLMEASWTARSLNIMSMNNTALTQSQAITSSGWAMEKPLMDAGLNAGLVAGFYIGRAWRLAFTCPPWCTILAPLIYAGLAAYLIDKVLNPLFELQEELKRSIHSDPGKDDDQQMGFAKAATSFARMNKILTEKFPDSIEDYSDQLLAANYSDAATQIRYTAWAEVDNTLEVAMPVVRQSFTDAFQGLTGAGAGDSTAQPNENPGVSQRLRDSLKSVKDIRDVYNAGLLGTHTNPFAINHSSFSKPDAYDLPSLNYFGNFRAQGYVDGTGPFNAARGELETVFADLYETLDKIIDGSQVGDAISDAVSQVVPGGIFGQIIEKIVMAIVNAIFKPLLGTAYNSQALTPEKFEKRLTEVYEWSTHYSETHYSNSWRVDGQTNVGGLFDLSAPPRFWRGILPGIYHGQDLSNIVDGSGFDPNDIAGSVSDAMDTGKRDWITTCYGDRRAAREAQLTSAKESQKRNTYRNTTPRPTDHNNETIPEHVYVQLNSGERAAVVSQAETQLRAECLADYEAEFGSDDTGGSTAGSTSGTTAGNNTGGTQPTADEFGTDGKDEDFTAIHGEAGVEDGGSGGSWNSPKKLQYYLEMVNWFFEPSYKMIALEFPLDAVLMPFAGPLASDRSAPDSHSNLWCGMPFGEGFLCTNETPMYAVNRQRLTPQFAMNIIQDLGLDLNVFPDVVRETYLADRDDWSLVVSATAPTALPIAELGFGQVPTEMSTMAQAEVFNSQWYDLFTQTWKAKLTPISLLDDTDHFPRLESSWTAENYNFVTTLSSATNANERVLNH